MKPILYAPTESVFTSNGIGVLSDAISCMVTEERNGAFELEMQYPMTGIHFGDISLRSIIKSKADQIRNPQLFRVYKISKPLNGIVTVFAEHISYDLSGIPLEPFEAASIQETFAGFTLHALTTCPFTFASDKTTTATMKIQTPTSIRAQLGGKSGSVLDVYGGEYEFDNYTVHLWASRGYDRGVSIRYGKNLTSLKQDENCVNVYTGVYPYWSGEDGVVQLPERIINVEGTFDFTRILTLDLTSEFTEAPTASDLRAKAQSYIEANDIGIPVISLTVEFAQLEQSEEYKGMALLERVQLCDTVRVVFPELGVDATAKAIRVQYNALLDRVEKVDLGSARTNLANTIVAQSQALEEQPSLSFLREMVDQLTEGILGARGGAVRLLDTDEDGMPDTLYIADNEDPQLAQKVWRFNYEGWGASTNGYNGPFTMGASLNTGIVADFITAGTLNAGLVSIGGTGTSLTGTSLTIVHSNVGNSSYTVIDQNGLRMYRNGTVVGGLYNVGGSYITASQALYNPSESSFRADIGELSSIGESSVGINFKYDGNIGGRIGAYYSGSRYGLGIQSTANTPMYIDCRNNDIIFITSGGTIGINQIKSYIDLHDD